MEKKVLLETLVLLEEMVLQVLKVIKENPDQMVHQVNKVQLVLKDQKETPEIVALMVQQDQLVLKETQVRNFLKIYVMIQHIIIVTNL